MDLLKMWNILSQRFALHNMYLKLGNYITTFDIILTSFEGSGNLNDIMVSSNGTGGIATGPNGIHSFISTSLCPCSLERLMLWGWQTSPTMDELLNSWGATNIPTKKQKVWAKKNKDVNVQTNGLDQLWTLVFNPTLCILSVLP